MSEGDEAQYHRGNPEKTFFIFEVSGRTKCTVRGCGDMAVEVDGSRDDGRERDITRYGEIRVMSNLFYYFFHYCLLLLRSFT